MLHVFTVFSEVSKPQVIALMQKIGNHYVAKSKIIKSNVENMG